MAVLPRRDEPLAADGVAAPTARPTSRRRRTLRRIAGRLAHGQRGFSMAEVVVAIMIFEFLGAGIIGMLTSTTAATRLARQRTLAHQAALSRIESIRAMSYDSVGIVDGNPSGSVAATSSVDTGGLQATVSTQISYVNDPTPLSYTSYANYKKVVVEVFRASDSRQLAQEVTYIAPPVKSSESNATINVQVVDYGDSTPVQGVAVALSTGPSAPRNDTSDVSGDVTFAGLTPNPVSGSQAYYDLSLTPPSGYAVLPDTVSPAAAAHVQLSPGQTWATALDLYQPSTIYVQLRNHDGTPFAGSATVTASYTRNATDYSEDFAYTGTALSITSISGVPLIPGVDYTISVSGAGFYPDPPSSTPTTAAVPDAYPTDLTHTFVFDDAELATTFAVTVEDAVGAVCSNADVSVSGGPWSVALNGTTGAAGEPAAFDNAVPVGAPYAIGANLGGYVGQLSGQTVASGPNAFTVTLQAGISC